MKIESDRCCPCGSDLSYESCCKPWHDTGMAPDAEALMRSRYTAYVLNLEAYLLSTWHSSTRPSKLSLDNELAPQWLGLQIKHHEEDSDGISEVEFIARYRVNGRAHRLHESSRFVKEEGKWYYVDGEISDANT